MHGGEEGVRGEETDRACRLRGCLGTWVMHRGEEGVGEVSEVRSRTGQADVGDA